jgi:Tubulin/FtsZ family, GTPase domain
MATVTIQVGQCGNQLGPELIDLLSSHCSQTKRDSFIDESNFARAVLIDAESKVIDECLMQTFSGWNYRQQNCVNQYNGSGNNWAQGFNPTSESFSWSSNLIRKEVERAENLDALLMVKSVAGGTGSGFGSRLLQSLRDEFPKKSIVSLEALPFGAGEVCVQSINAVLSIAATYEYADMICPFDNSEILTRMNQKHSSFSLINQAVASSFCHQVVPDCLSLSKLVYALSLDPTSKIATSKLASQSYGCMKKSIETELLKKIDKSRNRVRSVSICYITEEKIQQKCRNFYFSSPEVNCVLQTVANLKYASSPKSVSSLSIDQHFVPAFRTLSDQAESLSTRRAYTYAYSKYGVNEENIAEVLHHFKNIMEDMDRKN